MIEQHKPIIHHAPDDNYKSFAPEERAALELESALEGPKQRWAELEQATAKAPAEITNDTQAENFTTVIAQLQAVVKRVDDAHDDVKEPYLNAGRRVDGMTNVLRERIAIARDTLQAALTTYQVKKQNKIDAERAAVREKEAEDPEPGWTAAPKPRAAGRTKIRSVEGATAHLTTVIDMEIVDVTKIPARYLNRPRVLAALRAEILPDVRKRDVVEGVKTIEGLTSRVKA